MPGNGGVQEAGLVGLAAGDGVGAFGRRSVDDVAVAGLPVEVGGAPIGVVIVEVEDQAVRQRDAEEIAGGGVQNALGFSGRAAGVEDEERMFAVERNGGAIGRRSSH